MSKKKGYVFDRDSLSFRRERLTFRAVVKFLAIFATSASTCTLIVYFLFSFFFNTK